MFSRLPADFLLYPVKNADVSKKASIVLNFIMLFYRYLVKTTLRQVCLALSEYKSNFLKGKIPIAPSSPTYLTLKKASLCRVKFLNFLTCLKLI